VQRVDELLFELRATLGQFGLLDRFPRQRHRAPMRCHQIRAQRRMVVPVEVGPVQGDHDARGRADDELDPPPHHRIDVDSVVAQQPIDLLHATLRRDVRHARIGLPDRRDAQDRCVEHTHHAVGQRHDAKGMKVARKHSTHEAPSMPQAQRLAATLGAGHKATDPTTNRSSFHAPHPPHFRRYGKHYVLHAINKPGDPPGLGGLPEEPFPWSR
jgi:hypothetical protein